MMGQELKALRFGVGRLISQNPSGFGRWVYIRNLMESLILAQDERLRRA